MIPPSVFDNSVSKEIIYDYFKFQKCQNVKKKLAKVWICHFMMIEIKRSKIYEMTLKAGEELMMFQLKWIKSFRGAFRLSSSCIIWNESSSGKLGRLFKGTAWLLSIYACMFSKKKPLSLLRMTLKEHLSRGRQTEKYISIKIS